MHFGRSLEPCDVMKWVWSKNMLLMWYFHVLSDGAAFTTQSRSSTEKLRKDLSLLQNDIFDFIILFILSAIFLRSLSENYGSVS